VGWGSAENGVLANGSEEGVL